MDWNIQKILIFLRLKTSVREPIQILVSSTLHLVTALLIQGHPAVRKENYVILDIPKKVTSEVILV